MKTKAEKKSLDNYVIERTLGSGCTGKVKLGRSKEDDTLYALKILDPAKKAEEKEAILKSLRIEEKFLQEIDHPNIVKFFGLVENGVYRSKGRVKIVSYVVLEYVPNGELFHILFYTERLSENCARHFFKQLISAEKYLRSKNIAHRDIKPENLLLGSEMELKLADFGFATSLDAGVAANTQIGTTGYMAPEILALQGGYDPVKSDTFSCGTVLFVMTMSKPPFAQASDKCQMYKLLRKDIKKYFETYESFLKFELSAPLKSLIGELLDSKPESRPSFEDILASEWLSQPTDAAAAVAELTKKVDATKRFIELQQLEKEINKRSTKLVTRADREGLAHNPFVNLRVTADAEPTPGSVYIGTKDLPLALFEVAQRFKESGKGKMALDDRGRVQLLDGKAQLKIKPFLLNPEHFALSITREIGNYFDAQELKMEFVFLLRALGTEPSE